MRNSSEKMWVAYLYIHFIFQVAGWETQFVAPHLIGSLLATSKELIW